MELDDRIVCRIPQAVSILFQETRDSEFRNKAAEVLSGLAGADARRISAKADAIKRMETPWTCVVRIDGFGEKELFIELERSGAGNPAFREEERAALQFAGVLISDELKRRKKEPVSRERLSPRELEIAELVRKGLPNQEIGIRLGISTETVKRHLYNSFNKTGVNSRTGLIRYLQDKGLGG